MSLLRKQIKDRLDILKWMWSLVSFKWKEQKKLNLPQCSNSIYNIVQYIGPISILLGILTFTDI